MASRWNRRGSTIQYFTYFIAVYLYYREDETMKIIIKEKSDTEDGAVLHVMCLF